MRPMPDEDEVRLSSALLAHRLDGCQVQGKVVRTIAVAAHVGPQWCGVCWPGLSHRALAWRQR